MNWRKPLIFAALHLTRSKIPLCLEEIHNIEKMPKEELKLYQINKLKDLLIYAYHHVPYYRRILPEAGVIVNGNVNLENFSRIPILTKDIITEEKENLYSSGCKERKSYLNTSGGSTGEPIKVIQDKVYDEWNTATKLYFNQMLGKDIGEKEIKFWGSERDIIFGSIGLKDKLMNCLYNRVFINSFKLDQAKLEEAVKTWNSLRPKVVWSYVDSVYEFSRYLDKNKIKIYSPDAIIVTAGVLTKDVRNYIEEVIGTQVFNQYGSREVGVIACECSKKEGLHVFEFSQYLETINVDESGNSELLVTNLSNYSMPLIRYKIGDTVKVSQNSCSCGRSFSMLESVTGRTTNHFLKVDGSIIHGEYFTHLFYFKAGVKKFQIIQKDFDSVVCKVINTDGFKKECVKDIQEKIKLVMGENCKVEFEFVNDIQPSRSGKYHYTICEVASYPNIIKH